METIGIDNKNRFSIFKHKSKWLWFGGISYILLNAFLLTQEIYWFTLFPFALLLLYFCFKSMDKVVLFVVFATPISVVLELDAISFALPTEPLLFGLMCLFWLKLLIEGKFDKRVFKHPISILVFLYFAWMILASINSSMPLVSIKILLVHFWFMTVFYLFGTQLFQKFKNINRFLWLYILPLFGVVFYSLIRHVGEGLTHKGSGWVMEPFFIDHGIYGATIAFVIPVVTVYLFQSKILTKKPLVSVAILPLLIVLIFGLIFSYTRAAWISVAAALAFYFILKLKIKFKNLLAFVAIVGGLFFIFQNDILMELNRNKTDSNTDFNKHIKSMSNVRTDASNLERLNRWASASRMFQAKPLLGWGPGTYMFQYAPFQKPHEKTIISTNMHDVGGIHSEYFGPFVEGGIFGGLLFFILILMIVYRGMRVYHSAKDPKTKAFGLMAILALVTYLTHGFLNNYLDQDKTAVLFWGFTGLITAMDIKIQLAVSSEE